MVSRHVQKSRPAARPRNARWNVWLCALTNPGSARVSATNRDATTAYAFAMTWSRTRQQIPNALTIARFVAIPVFVVLYLAAGDGPAWLAGVFFAGAAATDQLDGYLARRWNVQSEFGKVADPLADRLMIGTAVVALWATGRIPIVAAAIVLARDLILVLGYKVVVPRGYDFEVSLLGKAATWVLYASLCFVIVTAKGTTWPVVLLWIGVALAILAGIQYVLRVRSGATSSPRRDTRSARE